MLNFLSQLGGDGRKFLVLRHRISVNDQRMYAMLCSIQKRKKNKKTYSVPVSLLGKPVQVFVTNRKRKSY